MKIRWLKIMVLGPVLLSLPMACMHLGDGHHSSVRQPSYQYSILEQVGGVIGLESIIIHQDLRDFTWEV